MKEKLIRITCLPFGIAAKIIRIEGGHTLWERLNEVGLHSGDYIKVIRQAPLQGPLLVRCNGQEIAVGRSIAAKIFVQVAA